MRPMGRTDERAKRPVTRRLRLLVVRCARCGVSSHRDSWPTSHRQQIFCKSSQSVLQLMCLMLIIFVATDIFLNTHNIATFIKAL